MLEHKGVLHNLPLLSLLLLFSSVVSSEIPLGSKFSVEESNFWISSNGDFSLGFFNCSERPNQYTLGIRFNANSIPIHERAVVWVAGADNFVGNKSYLQLTQTGDLVLFDNGKSIAWTSNTSHFSAASAALLNNGNLVLLQDRDVVWQSFMTPYDTLLPGQDFSASHLLQAASRNSVASFYTLAIVSGQLRLRWETNVVYWKSGVSFARVHGALFTSDGALKLLDHNFNSVWSVFGEDHNDSSVGFRFLRLDVDGNLRMYSWVEDSKSWRPVWQAVENQCNVFATCGHSGVCIFNASGSAVCKCPFGSISTDPNLKCLAPYEEGKCDESYATMVALEHTLLYGLYPPRDVETQSTLEECRKSCLRDLLCTSVSVINDGSAQCRAKQTRFVTGYAHPSLRSTSFVKICLDPVALSTKSLTTFSAPPPSFVNQSPQFCVSCLVVATSGTVSVLVIVQVGIGIYILKRRKSFMKTNNLISNEWNPRGLIMLSYSEIKDLTENFKHRLGPKAFKGVLPNNQAVVIKDLKETIEEKEFRAALSVIGSIHHRNLVKLEGYCCELKLRFVVYEFAKNDSVKKWIEDAKLKKRMTWRKRMEICLGVARAMAYLHTGCRKYVSHGNLKWENVVLDKQFLAKVTDFGLVRMHDDNSLTECDVASFGKMVLIMVTGMSDTNLSEQVYTKWKDGQVEGVIDSSMKAFVDGDEVERALRIALWCVQARESLRPSMGEVVKVLEGTLTIDPPPPLYVLPTHPGEELEPLEYDPEQ